MKKFVYQIINDMPQFYGQEVFEQLTKEGEQGWELVSVVNSASVSNEKTVLHYIFKREVL